MSTLFAGIFSYRRYKSLKENLIDDGLVAANNLAFSSELGCYAQNKDFLEPALRGIFRRQGLVGAAVYLRDGKLLAGSWKEKLPAELSPDIGENLKKNLRSFWNKVVLPGGKPIYEFYAPVTSFVEEKSEINLYSELQEKNATSSEELIGVVRVSLSTEYIRKDMLKLIHEVSALSVFFLVIGIFAAFYLSRRITQPILQLTAMAEDLGSGKTWTKTFSFFPKDEIGLLANTFLTMGDRIKEREERLEKWSEELEKRVEERTHELKESQNRLIHIERLAAIGQLAAAVSHDLKNPLTGIELGVVYLKKKLSAQAPEILQLLDSIGEEAEHANRIINDILIFSRPTLPIFKWVDVNKIIDEAFSIAQLSGMLKEINVTKNFSPDIPPINADPYQLRRVFENLITNSRQAMLGRGGIWVETKLGGDDSVEIRFTDNGPGISGENLAKIFNPFFTTRAKGTGLGLTIVKGIIEMHQGEIKVETNLGEGTTFVICLPIKQKEETITDANG